MIKFKRILAVALSAAMMFSMSSIAMAADYTAQAGSTVMLKTYLVVDEDANVPATTVEYSVSPGNAVSASATGELPVLAGIGTPTVSDATFTANQSATATNAEAALGSGNAAGKIAAMSNITVDFAGINFTAPGIYRYIVTQGAISPSGSNAETEVSTIDVYVTDSNGELAITNLVYDGTVTAAGTTDGNNLGTKDDKFVVSVDTFEIEATKSVTGNQGDKSKDFTITIEVTELAAGTVLNAIDADGNAGTITADSAGKASLTLSVCNGESGKVTGIPEGAKYTVKEAEANKDGYTTTGEVTTVTDLTADASVTVVNNKQGTIPTGVATSVGLGCAIAAVALCGIALTGRKKREN